MGGEWIFSIKSDAPKSFDQEQDESVFVGPHQAGIDSDCRARIFSCEVKLPPKLPSHPETRSLRHFIVPETVKKS